MEIVFEWYSDILELHETRPGYRAMTLRAIVVFISVLLIIRIGSRRFISKLSAFDMLVAIMIGSIGSRAITGNSAFGPSIASIAALVAFHWLFSLVCYWTDDLGLWLKGKACQLVKDGELQRKEMRRSGITRRDLHEALRSQGIAGDVDLIHEAWQERDGSISIIRKPAGQSR